MKYAINIILEKLTWENFLINICNLIRLIGLNNNFEFAIVSAN
ncbi:MAG: hypothetical protein K0R49_1712 [Burkholderiales bacterium]|jgi:hypothetical protein|nr:hypothetical protein [Burkholderiales bacterium]